jgi:UDP-N-acetylglucosamine 4-epimerase
MIQDRLIALNPELKAKKPIYRDFRAGDVMHSQADISKAQKILGYEPTHKIQQGLDEAMSWYMNKLG